MPGFSPEIVEGGQAAFAAASEQDRLNAVRAVARMGIGKRGNEEFGDMSREAATEAYLYLRSHRGIDGQTVSN